MLEHRAKMIQQSISNVIRGQILVSLLEIQLTQDPEDLKAMALMPTARETLAGSEKLLMETFMKVFP